MKISSVNKSFLLEVSQLFILFCLYYFIVETIHLSSLIVKVLYYANLIVMFLLSLSSSYFTKLIEVLKYVPSMMLDSRKGK